MKIPVTSPTCLLLTSFLLLAACNNADTKSDTATAGDTTASAKALPDKDSAIVTDAPKEPVYPPEESDSLKFCYIKKFYQEGDTQFIDADFIQFLTGEKAVAAARKNKDAEMEIKDGDTTYYVYDDYYILNENPRVRKLALADKVQCFTVSYESPRVLLEKSTLQKLKSKYSHTNYYILILNKNNIVTTIKEQYVP